MGHRRRCSWTRPLPPAPLATVRYCGETSMLHHGMATARVSSIAHLRYTSPTRARIYEGEMLGASAYTACDI